MHPKSKGELCKNQPRRSDGRHGRPFCMAFAKLSEGSSSSSLGRGDQLLAAPCSNIVKADVSLCARTVVITRMAFFLPKPGVKSDPPRLVDANRRSRTL